MRMKGNYSNHGIKKHSQTPIREMKSISRSWFWATMATGNSPKFLVSKAELVTFCQLWFGCRASNGFWN